MPPEIFIRFASKLSQRDSPNLNWPELARDLAWLLTRLERKQQHRLNRKLHERKILDRIRAELEKLDAASAAEPLKSVAQKLCLELVDMLPRPRGRQARRRGFMDPGPALPHELWKLIRPLALARLASKSDVRAKNAVLDAMTVLGISDSNDLEYFIRLLSKAKQAKPR